MSGKTDPSPPVTDLSEADARTVRFLKILVTVLTATMIAGLVIIVGLLVTRLPGGAAAPLLPDRIALPDGARAEAVTMGRGWVAVVTDAGEIVVLDAVTGKVRQRVKVGE